MSKQDNESASAKSAADKMEKIVSLCKRRGFIYPACEIYGGLANAYSYGPYGVQLKKNIKDIWWKKFVEEREDIVGLDGPIILHPKLWEASATPPALMTRWLIAKPAKSASAPTI
jgi:glycyl-tRNA synthetase